MKKKIILFGGSFNPVHNAHIAVAKFAMEDLKGDEFYFVQAKRSPFKKHQPQVSDDDRVKMLKLAISSISEFSIDVCELQRPAPSYTVDTLRHFKEKLKEDDQIYWLIGADMVRDLGKWYHIDEIFQLCEICIMNRGGVEKVDFEALEKDMGFARAQRLRDNMIATPFINISSTEIRDRIARGQDVGDLLDEKVLKYIYERGLYASGDAK